MKKDNDNVLLTPDWLFESSWEVCNKVGGIYTVLSTRAKTIVERVCQNLIFVGPDLNPDGANPLFVEDTTLYADWTAAARSCDGLAVRVGRWAIPGSPVAVLVDFHPLFPERDSLYGRAWELFGVNSLHGYGDYDEANMFSVAAARVVASFWRRVIMPAVAADSTQPRVVYQAHEWMTAMGMLFLGHDIPQIATIFTTHATTVGRSIAGNGKPLYDCMPGYDGNQMARELNVEAKHSVELQAALRASCFTTVSDITCRECAQLFGKPADVVLPNGFEDDFVPRGAALTAVRRRSRRVLLAKAGEAMGQTYADDTIIVSTGGRFEYRNKGYDLLLASLRRLGESDELTRDLLCVVSVPHWHAANEVIGRVTILFVPWYLDGHDGFLDIPYYDMLPAADIGAYPSYYEPWGYTPLESAAFHIPTITTDLAGFGVWVKSIRESNPTLLADENFGVEVIHRTDSNFDEAAGQLTWCMAEFSRCTPEKVRRMRSSAAAVARRALWTEFIAYYRRAYDVALRRGVF